MQRTAVLPRSRFGCTACREKHRKCDEQRPSCGPCEKRGLQCDYTTTLKWANPGGINSFDKSYPRKKKKDRKRADSVKNNVFLLNPSPTEQHENNIAKKASANYRPSSSETTLTTQAENDSLSSPSHAPRQGDSPPGSRRTSMICSPILQNVSSDSIHRLRRDESRSPITPNLQKRTHVEGLFEKVDTVAHVDETGSLSDSGNLDEIPSPHSFSSWIVDSTLSSLLNQIFDSPSEEIAFAYFFKHVCSVIPAYDGPQNPYRKLAIVALSYPVLLHGILAVSTAYMYNHGRSHAHILSLRQSRALNSLQLAINALQAQKDKHSLESPSSDYAMHSAGIFSILSAKEITLAAITMQTCSVLTSGVGVFEDHVKCGIHFIQDLGLFYNEPNTEFVWLLVYRFATVDVLLALLRFRSPIAPLDFFMYQPNEQLDGFEPSFREMMGFSQRVLCFLAKVSVLSEEMMKTNGSKAHVHAKAHILETEMRNWGQHYYEKMMQSAAADTPPALPLTSSEGMVDAKATLEIVCEAHYWIANLLLMRRVFFDATKSVRVQMIRQHLFRLMDQLPAGCGVDSCLPFPFYIAAREAVAPKDRDWVRRKHAAYMDFYRHQSRIAIMEAVEEIWKQSDNLDGCDVGDAPLWESPKEQFIRDMDKSASYFMF